MDQHLIVLEPAANIRARARAALTGNWQQAIIAMLIYFVFINLIPSVIDSLLGWTFMMPGDIPVTGSPSWLYLLLVSGPFTLGLVAYFMGLFRHRETQPNRVFEGFDQFGKAFVLSLVMGIFIFLWALLFIIPGIIAAFRYSQAFYIMYDNPQLSAMECLNESKRIMAGNKAKIFTLSLSFIGWAILASLPSGIYSAMFIDLNEVPTLLDNLFMFAFSAGFLWVGAYYYTALLAFYELLKGNISGQVFIADQFGGNNGNQA
jgi:uncharacterized membrane protein